MGRFEGKCEGREGEREKLEKRERKKKLLVVMPTVHLEK